MGELTELEKYLQGIPLTEENAALMQGRDPVMQLVIESETPAKMGSLTDDDREWLRRLQHDPGFQVLLRLLNSAITSREESAKVLSSTDPLGNKEKIVNEWAYVSCFRAVMHDIKLIVRQNSIAAP
jgi:hypothetical protein